jgi:hypothetical protein
MFIKLTSVLAVSFGLLLSGCATTTVVDRGPTPMASTYGGPGVAVLPGVSVGTTVVASSLSRPYYYGGSYHRLPYYYGSGKGYRYHNRHHYHHHKHHVRHHHKHHYKHHKRHGGHRGGGRGRR